ncbi:MAG: thiogalactoside acetyltransferase [Mucilaginibacter sp.]|nr:thiogalactoside acetyltransferase [Mucilaginibacter sp.]
MSKLLNYILNKIIGVQRRYKHALQADSSARFLPNFKIVKNRISGKQNNKILIGKECLLGVQIILETPDAKVSIGDRVYIGNSTIIAKTSISLGNDILVAWGVTFYDHDSHSLDVSDRDDDIRQTYKDFINERGNYLKNKNLDVVNSKPIRICDHAWIGVDAMILKGVTVGEGAIVGARSVVTKDVPPYTVVAGNPAKVVKHLNK